MSARHFAYFLALFFQGILSGYPQTPSSQSKIILEKETVVAATNPSTLRSKTLSDNKEQGAVALDRQKAQTGVASSQYDLGMRFLTGSGVDKDTNAALAWFQKAAANGSSEAKELLEAFKKESSNEKPNPEVRPDAMIELLIKENAALRSENQQLRRLLGENSTSSPSTANEAVANQKANVQNDTSSEKATYWMTSSSGKRHNSKCRYFKTSGGRLCGANDGVACKICGG